MALSVVQLRRRPAWQRALVCAWGATALVPLACIAPLIAAGDFQGLAQEDADVLGTGSLLIFLSMLAVRPLARVCSAQWLMPLRWWFGVVFFANACVDLVVASIVSGQDFRGGFLSRVAGHTFLVAGTAAVLGSVPLALTATKRAQKRLGGRDWGRIQRRGVYVVWGLIAAHLLLLFGPRTIFLRFAACSAPLALVRVHPLFTYRWRYRWLAGATLAALLGLFLWGWYGLWHEEIVRGVPALTLHPNGGDK